MARVCATGGSTAPEEGAFAEVVAGLMQGDLGVAQAVRAFAAVCQNRADQLRCTPCLRAPPGCSALGAQGPHLRPPAAVRPPPVGPHRNTHHLRLRGGSGRR